MERGGDVSSQFSLAPSTHILLLLSDSALPLGSFAYSSGLESFLAHHRHLPQGYSKTSLFHNFLRLSVESVAHSNVPYLLASFRDPSALQRLDNDLDASTPCTVARRASLAQGRALLTVWEKAFATSPSPYAECLAGRAAVEQFARDLKVAALSTVATISGHFAPLWGVICLSLGLQIQQAAYLFLFNHSKAILSAAVRASIIGPYQSQNVLAGQELQELLRHNLERVWQIVPEDAGQVVPTMDLWIGRHELLYSRIFNS